MLKYRFLLALMLFVGPVVYGQEERPLTTNVFVVPNFHPASCGWLTDFSTERNYCANSYFAHMDRVNENPDYKFVLSEVNNMIAMLNFQPARFQELKNRIKEGRIELVNGMFLELCPNLSGGEAIVRMGVDGIRWQEQMLGVRPRFNWLIDVTGMNEQMAQIGAGLGFDAQVYCRNNISNNLLHWAESPDGTRLLSVVGGHYISSTWRTAQKSGLLLSGNKVRENADLVKNRVIINNENNKISVPEWSPYLVLQGLGDYSLPPVNKEYPSNVIGQWHDLFPGSTLRFSTFSEYFDRIHPKVLFENKKIPVVKGGWPYRYKGFWVANQKVKKLYRQTEHLLQTSEMLATIGSFNGKVEYPSTDLYHAWLLLHLNTDRNTIWGAAGGMVFVSEKSWDVNDRFNWISEKMDSLNDEVLLGGGHKYLTWFNPVNWNRNDPQMVTLPKGMTLKGLRTQNVEGQLLFVPEMSSTSVGSLEIINKKPPISKRIALPRVIKTKFYQISIDPVSGEILDITLQNSGKKILGKGSNIIMAEQSVDKKSICEHLPDRNERVEIASTRGKKAEIVVEEGAVAVVVKICTSLFKQGDVKQIIKIYNDNMRIDFDLCLEDIPGNTLVSAAFPAPSKIDFIRRGIPYGFAQGNYPKPTTKSFSNVRGVNPAVRWSDYQLENGAGFAILDRGVTGREHQGDDPRLLLTITANKYFSYDSNWLSGKGLHQFKYALVGYGSAGIMNNIPRMAWEYNSSPLLICSEKPTTGQPFFSSSQNVILHSVHREGDEVELRFAECTGNGGLAKFKLGLLNNEARLTNFLGEGNRVIHKQGDWFSMNIRPQQIVTVRVKTDISVEKVVPLTDWSPMVPKAKRDFLNTYDKNWVGHPPR